MYKILSSGTSFNHGLALHFYKRHTKGLKLNYTLRPEERELNVYNAFHSILARKLNVQSEILNYVKFGLDSTFDDTLYGIKLELQKEQEIPIKIVIIQLSTAEKEFFVYNDKVYRINFNSHEEFIISKNELINSIPTDIRENFTQKFEEEFDLYMSDTELWRENHAIWFVNKLNELNKLLLEKGIILQVISYYTDYNKSINMFDNNLFVKLLANEEYFYDIKTMCDTNKLRIRDDIGGIDEHPNFEGHQVVADSLYESIIKHPLYQSI
jgi:hypothetical protein